MSNTLTRVSVEQLKRAVEIREQIESLNEELAAILGGELPSPKRRGMSSAGRQDVAEAQRPRWTKLKGQKAEKPEKAVRRKMSPVAKAKLAAVARARWAKIKAAGKSRL